MFIIFLIFLFLIIWKDGNSPFPLHPEVRLWHAIYCGQEKMEGSDVPFSGRRFSKLVLLGSFSPVTETVFDGGGFDSLWPWVRWTWNREPADLNEHVTWARRSLGSFKSLRLLEVCYCSKTWHIFTDTVLKEM